MTADSLNFLANWAATAEQSGQLTDGERHWLRTAGSGNDDSHGGRG